MDTVSLSYFLELSKDLNMTRTAKRLFISQQTLSNHIARLEEQFGAQLFYRKPSLSLTCAGEFVQAFAVTVSKENRNLSDILAEIKQEERGFLRFGASLLRMNACLPSILPEFSSRYPNVELRLTENTSARLEALVLEGDLDLAVVLSAQEDPSLLSHHLMRDPIYLCVPDSLLMSCYGDQAEALKQRSLNGAELRDFARVPFCLVSNRLGRQISEEFLKQSITPVAYATSTDSLTSLTLCNQGLSACFMTHMRLAFQRGDISPKLDILPLMIQGKPMTQELSLIRRKDRYLTHYAKLFIDLLFSYFNAVEHIHMRRLVPSGGKTEAEPVAGPANPADTAAG